MREHNETFSVRNTSGVRNYPFDSPHVLENRPGEALRRNDFPEGLSSCPIGTAQVVRPPITCEFLGACEDNSAFLQRSEINNLRQIDVYMNREPILRQWARRKNCGRPEQRGNFELCDQMTFRQIKHFKIRIRRGASIESTRMSACMARRKSRTCMLSKQHPHPVPRMGNWLEVLSQICLHDMSPQDAAIRKSLSSVSLGVLSNALGFSPPRDALGVSFHCSASSWNN